MSVYDAVTKIRGEAGSTVKLVVSRNGQEKSFEIIREQFTVKSVESEIKPGNIGYLEISRFDDQTADLVRATLEDFTSKGVNKIIIDLRDNPGGYLDTSVDVASEFIEKGVIVSEKKDSENGKKEDYKASGRGKATGSDVKLVVLTNQGSASASEIVAGALKDYKRAILVGEKTFGKGSVQTIENLGKGYKMRITVAHWYTPSGKNISKEGIAPDIEVKMTDQDYNENKDPQLDKAIELINKS
jgi:carboxyl-terminal processing protease